MRNVLDRLKCYFDNDAWMQVQNVSDMKANDASGSWACKVCDEILSNKFPVIGCDKCEEWFHFKCTNIKRCGKGEWICAECKKGNTYNCACKEYDDI